MIFGGSFPRESDETPCPCGGVGCRPDWHSGPDESAEGKESTVDLENAWEIFFGGHHDPVEDEKTMTSAALVLETAVEHGEWPAWSGRIHGLAPDWAQRRAVGEFLTERGL